MSLQLVLDGSDGIDIPLEDSLLAAWRLQLDRAVLTRSTFAMTERLAACFAASLCQCLDPDLRPPTEKQLPQWRCHALQGVDGCFHQISRTESQRTGSTSFHE